MQKLRHKNSLRISVSSRVNGVVKRANRVIFSAISKTLFILHKGKWVEELPKMVWSHNTIASRTTSFTPYKLLYGEEAMLLGEIKH
jgi:hypothetical protein